MSLLKNRYEIVALVEAKMCNPNGDPDMANQPRMDFETNLGIITDVAFKARMRNYVYDAYHNEAGHSILMINGNNINRNIAEAMLAVNNTDSMEKVEDKKTEEATKYMCEKYWDVRTFGAVLSTGLNAGQVRGAAQVSMALSIDPIEPSIITITRDCYVDKTYPTLEEYDNYDKHLDPSSKRSMGTKAFIPYGLYVMKMSVSANLAEKVGFTEDDMDLLLESVVQMYNNDVSSSKMGMSVLTPVIVFKHIGNSDPGNEEQLIRERKLGCAPAYKLFNMVSIERKKDVEVVRDSSDYNITLHMEDLPAGVECGLKKAPYEDVEWLNKKEEINLMEV